MPIDDLKDTHAPHAVSVAPDMHGDRRGDRDEVGAGAGDPSTRIGQAFLMAREGYGYEDITVRLNLPRTKEWKVWVRMLVLKSKGKWI